MSCFSSSLCAWNSAFSQMWRRISSLRSALRRWRWSRDWQCERQSEQLPFFFFFRFSCRLTALCSSPYSPTSCLSSAPSCRPARPAAAPPPNAPRDVQPFISNSIQFVILSIGAAGATLSKIAGGVGQLQGFSYMVICGGQGNDLMESIFDDGEVVYFLVAVDVVDDAAEVLLARVGVQSPAELAERALGDGLVAAADLLGLHADILPAHVLVVADAGEALGQDDDGVSLYDETHGRVAGGLVIVVSVVLVGDAGRAEVDDLHLVEDLGELDVDLGDHGEAAAETNAGDVDLTELQDLVGAGELSDDVLGDVVPHALVGLLHLAVVADVGVDDLVGVEDVLPDIEEGVGVAEGEDGEGRVGAEDALDVLLLGLDELGVVGAVLGPAHVALPVHQVQVAPHDHRVRQQHLLHVWQRARHRHQAHQSQQGLHQNNIFPDQQSTQVVPRSAPSPPPAPSPRRVGIHSALASRFRPCRRPPGLPFLFQIITKTINIDNLTTTVEYYTSHCLHFRPNRQIHCLISIIFVRLDARKIQIAFAFYSNEALMGRQTLRLIFFIGKLTMLKGTADGPVGKLHYFESQLTDCSPHRSSCRKVSPSFCLRSESRDLSNIGQEGPRGQDLRQRRKQPGGQAEGPSRALSLREQIDLRLGQQRAKRHLGSVAALPDDSAQPLSAIRRMLTQDSPPCAMEGREGAPPGQISRREKRVQFELRQQQLIQLRQQRQELGRSEKLRKDAQECTFRPRLTAYRRL